MKRTVKVFFHTQTISAYCSKAMVETDGCPALGRNHYSKFSQTFPFQKENTYNQAGQTRG